MEEKQVAPKVSAIVVSWNNAAQMRRCLEALEHSTNRQEMEVVVVDCGSQDESPRMDSDFPSINMLRLPRHFGIVKALNIGMRTAVGEYFLILPPEIELQPDTAGKLAAALDATPEAVAVCPLSLSPDGEAVTHYRSVPVPREAAQAWRDGDFADWVPAERDAEPVPIEYPNVPVFMARANFLKGMRYIDERYGNSGWDLELCCQIRRAAKHILLLPRVSVTIHPTPAGIPSPAARAQLSADRALSIAMYAGKHFSWSAGAKARIGITLHALKKVLAALVTFRDVQYHFALLSALISGQKIDGSQSAF